MSWQTQAVDVKARALQLAAQVAHLVGRPRKAMHADHPDLSVADEIERVPERHARFVITPVRTLTAHADCAWIETITAGCVLPWISSR